MKNIVIIGLGGIGTALVGNLCRYLNYSGEDSIQVTLIDGDKYESKNFARQSFFKVNENKAVVKRIELLQEFPKITFKAIGHYISEHNINSMISENDIVFMGVDNHPTRKLVSDYMSKLQNCVLISGGNDLIDGNVTLFIRRNGRNITASLTDYHPEIKNPTGKHPEDMSCEELATSSPQLLFTNLSVAVIMCWYYYKIQNEDNIISGMASETYFDIQNLALHSVNRKPKTN